MPLSVARRIAASGLSIYDSLADRPELFIKTRTLERILSQALVGLSLDYPIRTRSKVVKTGVCDALGYPVPERFRRTKPRFPGQNFDTFVQKADNLQIWNEEVSASRRYVLIRVDDRQVVTRVRVVTGEVIAQYDRTGTLTHKYQARSRGPVTHSCLVSAADTAPVQHTQVRRPAPSRSELLPIQDLYRRLVRLVGRTIANPGLDQERHRGWGLHQAVFKQLGKASSCDSGQFPDIPDQLLELKLQTAPTIDLGLVCPDSTEVIADSPAFRHCDVRYAVYYGTIVGRRVCLDHLVMATGADFFTFFRRFEGRVKNAKLQIPLPRGFFD